MVRHSWSEESKRDDGDSVGAAVGPRAGGEHHHVDNIFLLFSFQPEEMLHVGVVNCAAELHFDGEHPPVCPLDDEIDFPLAAKGAQVPNAGLGCLGVHADGQRGQRFKECPNQWPFARLFGLLTGKERLGRRPEEPRCQRRIGELVLRRV